MKKPLFTRSFKILTKSIINAEFLDDRVKRFLRYNEFTSRYISLIVKISGNNSSFVRSIGKRFILDLENKDDVSKYIIHLVLYLNRDGNTEEWYNGVTPERIHFDWVNATEMEYLTFINNQKISKLYKKLPLNITSHKNIPFDVNYTSWGSDIKYISFNETIIKGISFDSRIDNIIVRVVNNYKTVVSINYIADNLTFTDYSRGNNTYCRIFANKSTYYFDSTSNPLFYFKPIVKNNNFNIIKINTKIYTI